MTTATRGCVPEGGAANVFIDLLRKVADSPSIEAAEALEMFSGTIEGNEEARCGFISHLKAEQLLSKVVALLQSPSELVFVLRTLAYPDRQHHSL